MPASVRSIAASCGVSVATVSRALAGNRNVLPATRRQIVDEAQRQAYKPNRLVGSLMAHLRVSRTSTFVGNLAIVHVPSRVQKSPGPQQRRIIRGAQARAKELGYQLYELSLGEEGMKIDVVVRVLRARGVVGLIFLYSQPLEKPLAFPWDDFVALDLDYGAPQPVLHTVCHDHYASIMAALTRLRALGYRRAGMFLERYKDERTYFRWSAAFRSFQERLGGIGRVPVLEVPKINEAAFTTWFRKHEPDLVIGHFDACVGWLDKLSRRVPADVGFFTLNWESRSVPCAGIDPRLEMQGTVAVDTLIAQLHPGERGLPAVPRSVMVPGRIVDGPTVRAV